MNTQAAGKPMSTASGSATDKAPPLQLPGEHFAAGMLFFLAGTAGLAWVAPVLAGGGFLAVRAGAVTHLFTLGWITTSIMGALYQFLPVALDRPIRSVRAAHTTFALFVPGLIAFVIGLATFRGGVMLGGAVLFGTGILLFLVNLGMTLQSASRRDVTWWALACAAVFLGVTLVLGLALAGNLRWGYLGGGRVMALAVHLHIAIAGWVLLVMVGVAQRLLPMFLLSHGAGDGGAKVAVALLATGCAMLALLHHSNVLLSTWIPSALIAGGCGAFLVQARAFYVRRVRRALDPGMRLAAAGLLLVGCALLLSAPVVFTGAPARVQTAYVMAAILGISLFVAAHYYKIVPFLIWFHRFGPLAGRQPVPLVSQLYSARAAGAAGVLLAAGAVITIASVAAGAGAPARAGAMVLMCGAMTQTVQMTLLMRKRP